jgi:flagellar biogenesis protein FliO
MIDSPLLGLLLLGALAATPLVLRRVRAAAPDGLRVMGRTALHKSAVVAVVAVGERRLLLGAGERGVQLLTELDPATDAPGTSSYTDPTARSDTADRTDADRHVTSTDLGTPEALDALLGPPGSSLPPTGWSSSTTAGPGNGLVDRLRAMTVRTAPQHPAAGIGLRASRAGRRGGGRPTRDPLRR